MLWLDHDTIITSDLGQLFGMALEHAVAGAPEYVFPHLVRPMTFRDHVRECPPAWRFVRELDAATFNTGVLLLDLARWRSGELTRRIADWAWLCDGCFLDQLALNLAFQGSSWHRLDWRWNARFNGSLRTPRRVADDVNIFHWNTHPFPKYWQAGRNSSAKKDDRIWRPFAARHLCEAAPWSV